MNTRAKKRRGLGPRWRRPPRPRAGLGLLALAICAAAAAAPAGATRAGATRHRRHAHRRALTCASRQVKGGFTSGPVRLFTMGPTPAEYQSEVTTRLLGCLKPRGRVYLLGYISHKGNPNVGDVESPRAAAPYAAFALAASNEIAGKYGMPSPESITVKSVNLQTGVTVASASFTEQPSEQSTSQQAVPSLQLAPSGWIAWLLSSNSGETLYAYDSHGQHTLDSGNIDPASLQISGATVTWTNAGTQRSATLG